LEFCRETLLLFCTSKALELDERMILTNVLYASPLMRLMPRKLLPSLCLSHLVNLLWTGMSIVVKRVKALSKGLFAVRATIVLMSIGHFAMFVGFGMTAEPRHSVASVQT
jgi:hypothetical protein